MKHLDTTELSIIIGVSKRRIRKVFEQIPADEKSKFGVYRVGKSYVVPETRSVIKYFEDACPKRQGKEHMA